MTRVAEPADESVRTGLLGLRMKAVEAGKAGVDATAQAAQVAEHRLTGGAEAARKELAKTSRRTRKQLARRAGQTRKELARSKKQAGKAAAQRRAEMLKPGRKAKKAAVKAAKAAGQSKKSAKRDYKNAKLDFKAAMAEAKAAAKGGKRKHRKWPWLLGLGAVAAAAVAMRPKEQPPVAPVPPRSTDPAKLAGQPEQETASAKSSSAGDGKK
jgi:hypothetical protein